METYSVFLSCHFSEGEWVKDLEFHIGDLKEVDTSKDWRFCEVDGKREEAIYLGKYSSDFPVIFPMEVQRLGINICKEYQYKDF